MLTKSKAGTTYTKGDIKDLCNKMKKTYEECDRYSLNAIPFAKEYDWTSIAGKILRVYDQIME